MKRNKLEDRLNEIELRVASTVAYVNGRETQEQSDILWLITLLREAMAVR